MLVRWVVAAAAVAAAEGLGVVVKSLHGTAHSGKAVAEPHLRMRFSAVGVEAGDVGRNLAANGLLAAHSAREVADLRERGRGSAKLQQAEAAAAAAVAAAAEAEGEVPGMAFVWQVDGQHSYTGRSVDAAPCVEEGGHHLVTVTEQTSGERVAFTLPCRRIRRHLWELTAQQRKEFFLAVQTMYRTPTDEGRRKYGGAYLSMQDVWTVHALLAADTDGQLLSVLQPSADLLARAATERDARPYVRRVSPRVAGGAENVFIDMDGDRGVELGVLPAGGGGAVLAISSAVAGAALDLDGADAKDAVTRLGAAALVFEAAVRAVDPSVTVPYFDEDRDPEQAGHAVPMAEWRGGSAAVGRWALLPVVTERVAEDDGRVVHRGFQVPLVAHRAAPQSVRDSHDSEL
eukprot:TRINITY_DN6790_c3_g1_i1.p1 TRINITY_DN6790_c3_g1~~TRINITY_DN6790_c3_g1_i1.p1  ORF type:complete len:402 (+),score=152.79 TRINITY_DN6790_c3_g1_i1:100-1305(+)